MDALKSSPRRAERAPWHFRLALSLIRRRIRGGYRLVGMARRLGRLNVVVPYVLEEGLTLDVPLYRRENLMTAEEAREYEALAIACLVEEVKARRPAAVTLVDCGADIGLISTLLSARCPDVARIVAFEPNPEAFPILRWNLERLSPPGECHAAAVSDFSGRAELRSPGPGTSDHARFIVPSPEGEIPVMRVDDLGVDPGHGLLLKIDVEGAELAVLRGAAGTLAAAAWFVVLFEAHPEVARRTGIDPIECVRLLGSLGARRFRIAEAPEVQLREDRPFYDQVPRQICNVICVADSPSPPRPRTRPAGG
jgi:FkbM family methyltransferase